MTFVLTRIKVDDYDRWKEMFDTDPPGARKAAKGYRLFRGVEDPNEVTIAVEFASPEDANTARERVLASGVLERVTVKSPPTIVEEAETLVY
jgi:hypothetical protein